MKPRFWINYGNSTMTYWDGKQWQFDVPFRKVTIKQLLDMKYASGNKEG